MTNQTREQRQLQAEYESRLIDIVRDRDEMPNGDLQGCLEAVVMGIIRDAKAGKL